MLADAAVAPIAALFADPARVAMLLALSDGREVSAGELALLAGVTRSTASLHLTKLVEGGLVAARPEAVLALEALAVLAPQGTPRTHRQAKIGRAVRTARTCYDHLAGRVGVGLTTALIDRGVLVPAGRQFEVTASGERLLGGFGIDLEAARRSRRVFALACLDWSERVHHLAGSLGGALLTRLLDLNWIERTPASRAVQVTPAGRQGLARVFGLEA